MVRNPYNEYGRVALVESSTRRNVSHQSCFSVPTNAKYRHKAILSYLSSSNLHNAYGALRDELAQLNAPNNASALKNGDDDQRYKGLLEKKWTSVIRLQKKVLFPATTAKICQIMDLEARLHALQTELDFAPASMRQKNLDPATWVPRNPARHSLSGHRMPITGLAFHPTFTVIATCSEDTTIKIWDWETGEFEQTIKGHTKSVHDVDFSFDGKLLSTTPLSIISPFALPRLICSIMFV